MARTSPGTVTTLKKVNPYRSGRSHRADGVYHDRSDCPTGRLLHSQELIAGRGGLLRCPECTALDAADAPVPDEPGQPD